MGLVTQSSQCGPATISFVVDDVALEVMSFDITTGNRALKVELFAEDDTVKAEFTIPANDTVHRDLNKPQRAKARVKEILKADGSSKFQLAFPYRVSTL